MVKWSKLPKIETIDETLQSLRRRGIEAYFFEDSEDAKRKVFEILPEGSEVMTMLSKTLDILGISARINDSGRYVSVRKRLNLMNRETQVNEMQKLGSAPEWAIGSVHALTKDGTLLIASRSGSQLPAYVYGSSHVIFVVGSQKIVRDVKTGLKRIYEYCLPLENDRAKRTYGIGSAVNKILILNNEVRLKRIYLILINEVIGF